MPTDTPDPFDTFKPPTPAHIAFSYFSSYIAAAPPHTAKTVTLADLCAGIQRGTWAQQVAHVREIAPHRWDRNPDNPKQKGELAAEYTSRKDQLPYVVMSGTWDPAHRHADGATHAKQPCSVNGLITPSGLRLIDLDPPARTLHRRRARRPRQRRSSLGRRLLALCRRRRAAYSRLGGPRADRPSHQPCRLRHALQRHVRPGYLPLWSATIPRAKT